MEFLNTLKRASVVSAVLLAGGMSTAVFAQEVVTPAMSPKAVAAAESPLASQVQAALAQDTKLNGADLHVESKDGNVRIWGTATNDQAIVAYREARQIPGVKSVKSVVSFTDING